MGGYAGDHLSPHTLRVNLPFACKHQRRILQQLVKTDGFQHQINAHAQGGAAERPHTKPHAPGCTGAWQLGEILPQTLGGHLAQVAQALIQTLHHGLVRPLLGGKHSSCAGFSKERVVDVAHHLDIHSPERFLYRAAIHLSDL